MPYINVDENLPGIRSLMAFSPATAIRTRSDRGPRRLRSLLPRTERALDEGDGFRSADAGHHDRAVVRDVVLLIKAADVVERECARRSRACQRPNCHTAFAVEQAGEAFAGDRRRLRGAAGGSP